MIALTEFSNKTLGVLGLGASGLATVNALQSSNAHVLAWDENPETRNSLDVKLTDLEKTDFAKLDFLVLSPGIPLTHPEPHPLVKKARDANVEVIGDMELFARQYDRDKATDMIIAITGTNGKSTTTALLSHVLLKAGWDVQMGGNIGTPILDLAGFTSQSNKAYILECSSYQIDLSPSLSASIGVLLNITPDHIDRHGSFENYVSIKESLLERCQHKIRGAVESPAKQNIIAVQSVCDHLGIDTSISEPAIKTFRGLPHRLESIGKINKTCFINDSKATNAQATATALSSFDSIYWIAGGIAKEGGISDLSPYFDSITKAYLYGESAELFALQLSDKVSYEIFTNLMEATACAAHDAISASQDSGSREAVVLFSPASSSFDQFRNFEHRGDTFKEIVSNLDNFTPMEIVE